MNKRTIKTTKLLSSLFIALLLSGCTSFGKGVVEAVLEKSENEDTRQCQVWGQSFKGIAANLDNKKGKTKILFVHGVGDHVPGYTTQFLEKLAKNLYLNARSAEQKNIELTAPLLSDKTLGNLRISHLLNEQNGQELTFYELTWSEISRAEKQILAFDTSGDHDFRRAKINGLLKKFSNDAGADPVIFSGESREPILATFGQSFCWMATADWQELPSSGKQACIGLDDSAADRIAKDHYVFISHSMGSRIVTDGLDRIIGLLSNYKSIVDSKALEAFKNKHIRIYMLSNQLPMLQLGRKPPEVTGDDASYCQANGANYNKRMFKETDIVAFSDPNDLLSYSIPHEFAEKYIDSRLCADITNVNINVAPTMDAFGLTDFANPMTAHIGYDTDDRVIALIAQGIGTKDEAPLIKQRCTFTKEVH
ncbi:hypothetical protein [Crenothrix polyspora]|uniref:Lipoprotein n=1 Tax=Crenothrix polyspora TaxID=360316 RepID=A0A1R4HID4_9GAMM|nr:hypothetical protein [Crenothrix polyspora]SJM95996.1 conserved exported hypothetical protein [Crenothrix polyspora]